MKNDRSISHYNFNDQFDYLHSVASPPEDVPIELHDFFELYYFISGDFIFYIEGQAYEMNKGDFLIISNDELHRAMPCSETPYERIVIHFDRLFLDGFSSEDYRLIDFLVKRKLGNANHIKSSLIDTQPFEHCLNKIEEAIQERSPYTYALVKTNFIQLLIEMNSLYSDRMSEIQTSKRYDQRITALLKYINANLDQKITLKELEDKFFINRYYLCHVFKKNTGFTVFEYISNKRIMKAKSLLVKGLPVIEVCYAVGFNDYSNFYKVFKRLIGMSPKQFVQMN